MEEEKPEETGEEQQKSVIEIANETAERIERANEEAKKIMKQQENAEARARLGGKSVGVQPVEKKEDDPQEYAQRALRGEIGDKKS